MYKVVRIHAERFCVIGDEVSYDTRKKDIPVWNILYYALIYLFYSQPSSEAAPSYALHHISPNHAILSMYCVQNTIPVPATLPSDSASG